MIIGLTIAYVAIMLLIGVWHKAPRTAEEFFLAGRENGVALLTGSLIATIFGAFGVMGVAGKAYGIGLSAGWYHWVGTLGLLILGFWALRRVSLGGVYTLPEMLGQAYGPVVRQFAGVMIVLAWLSIISGQFLAGGKIVQFLVAQAGLQGVSAVPVEAWTVLIGAIVTFYTVFGGQRSVIRTDLIQAIFIFVGLLVLFATLLMAKDQPITKIQPESWSFPFSETIPFTTWLQLLLTLGVPFLVGPDIYSRILSGRDVETGRRAVLIAATIMIPLVLLIVLCGMMGKVRFPDGVKDSEQILLMLAFDHMPVVASALLVAALLAAIMSSADTCLMTVSTIITRDIVGGVREERTLETGRALIAIAGTLSILVASAYGSIIGALYSAYKIYSPAVLVPFLAMVIFRKHRFSPLPGLMAPALGAAVASLGMILGSQQLGLLAFAAPAVPLAVDLLRRK